MGTLLIICLACVCLLGGLFAGIIIGITDCKRTFQIPKGAMGVDENGYIYP